MSRHEKRHAFTSELEEQIPQLAPGDWIVGDRDGLVIVPGERLEEILAEAEEKVATENEIRESVRQGMMPLEAYERYGTF